MSDFTYIIAEGPQDVAFLGRILKKAHKAEWLQTLERLDSLFQAWLPQICNWPSKSLTPSGSATHDIGRSSVFAPLFWQLPSGKVVVLRSAGGIDKIADALLTDQVYFRRTTLPESIGVVLDSDQEPEQSRFTKLTQVLAGLQLTPPSKFGEVSAGAPRVGAISLPGSGQSGSLEDLLAPLGATVYPNLAQAAHEFVEQVSKTNSTGDSFKDFRGQSGPKKAHISAMAAVLKPGRSVIETIKDHDWVSAQTLGLDCLKPCLAFLTDLLTPPGGTHEDRR